MAVQFAIYQGDHAAINIIRHIHGRKLLDYRPVDLGLVIPLGDNRACGYALGRPLRGLPAIAVHYLMCLYRLYGLKNKLGVFRGLMRKGGQGCH